MYGERINVSLTEDGLAILDRERESMGLSRSAMFEVLLRFWVRDQRRMEQDRAAPSLSGGGRVRPWLRLEPKTPSPQVFTALTVATQAIITREGLYK